MITCNYHYSYSIPLSFSRIASTKCSTAKGSSVSAVVRSFKLTTLISFKRELPVLFGFEDVGIASRLKAMGSASPFSWGKH